MAKKDEALVRLGANLRRAREKRGWSQEELAHRCGVHRTYLGSVERGKYNPSASAGPIDVPIEKIVDCLL